MHKMKSISALVGLLGLAACQTTGLSELHGAQTKYVGLPPAPMAPYHTGDTFIYASGKAGEKAVRKVVRSDKESVSWETETGYHFTTYHNIFLPELAWDGPSSTGRAVNRVNPSQLFPLKAGNLAQVTVNYETFDKQTKQAANVVETWDCKVSKPRAVTVPAGTFDAFKVTCARVEGFLKEVTRKHVWYYAPEVGTFVKRSKTYDNGRRRTVELVSYTRGKAS